MASAIARTSISSDRPTIPQIPHMSGRSLVGPARRDHCRQRLEDQADVSPERPVRDVQVIELDHFFERDVGPPEYLPEPRYAGREVETGARPAVDPPVLGLDQGPGTDQA